MYDFIINDGVLVKCKNNLMNALLSDEVKVIGEEAFANINQLRSIRVTDRLTKIGVRAFDNCTALRDVLLPDTGDLIIEDSAFTNCPNLNDATKEKINSINPAAFE